jgi:Predicted integral membrane protein (DUF2269)
MGVGTGIYKLLFVLHILSAIVGFGAVMLNGIYGMEAEKRKGVGGLAIGEANFRVSSIGEWFIYAVPVWGILLVLTSDSTWKFSQAWVGLAILIYITAIAISHAIVIPSAKKMNKLGAELVAMGPPPEGAPAGGPPPQVAEMEATSKKLKTFGPILDLAVVAIVFLMVFKPGA